MMEIPGGFTVRYRRAGVKGVRTSRCIGGLVYSDEAVAQFEHVVPFVSNQHKLVPQKRVCGYLREIMIN